MRHKAVLLDRDGTINEDRGYVHTADQFFLLPDAVKALRILMDLEYLLVIITNQSGVARGLFSEPHLKQFLKYFHDRLNILGVFFSGIYYCPHHPKGIVPEYRINCQCRKPGTGMFLQAINELGLDIHSSYTIGDSVRDIIPGNITGSKTILISDRNNINKDTAFPERPDFISKNLFEAALFIKESSLHI